MSAKEKITKAKVQLILEQPFFATLALNMRFIEDAAVQTACTDGKSIKYNPAFINGLTADECKTLIAHEVMHPAMLHHTRRSGRDPKKWNEAADYAINPLLQEAGFKLPEGGLSNPAFKGLSAEKIYSQLPDPPKDDGSGSSTDALQGVSDNADGSGQGSNQNPGPGDWGRVEDAGEKLTESQVDEIEAQAKQVLAQAAQVAKQAGKLPANMQRLVNEVLKPVIPWREALSRFVSEIARNDYNWKRPSPRYAHTGLYLPVLENEEVGRVALVVDTSGSIDVPLLNQFAAEISEIASIMQFPVTVIYADAKVQGVEELADGEKLNPKGGGGTDFIPGFKYVEENIDDAKAVVYFTDGCCSSFPKQPDIPVLWGLYGGYDFKPPFGEVIEVNEN